MEIVVDVRRQRLHVVGAALSFPISTAAAGVGCEEGSGKTPLGRHRVVEKIGAGAPLLAVFKSRELTGEEAFLDGPEAITTRILRLDGLEEENANSFQRYIYIHGTNRISELGKPASKGCIRLHPEAMVALFDLVPVGTVVSIVPIGRPLSTHFGS